MNGNTNTKFVITYRHTTVPDCQLSFVIDVAQLDKNPTMAQIGVTAEHWEMLAPRPYREKKVRVRVKKDKPAAK